MYLRPAKLKKGKQRKKAHASLQPKCKYGRACTRKGCIYRHDVSDDADRGGTQRQVCMAFLSGSCLFGNRCRNRHPHDSDCEELRVQYAQVPCRWGKFCETEHCLYFHGDAVAAQHSQQQQQKQQRQPQQQQYDALEAQAAPPTPAHGQGYYSAGAGAGAFGGGGGGGGGAPSSFLKPVTGSGAALTTQQEWQAGGEERRVDPTDGGAYTLREFLEFYGGTAEWDVAGIPPGNNGFGSGNVGGGGGGLPWQPYGQQQPQQQQQQLQQQQQYHHQYHQPPHAHGGDANPPWSAQPATAPPAAAAEATAAAAAVGDGGGSWAGAAPPHMKAAGDLAREAALGTAAAATAAQPSASPPPQLSFEQAAALFAAGAAVIRHHLGAEDVAFDLASKIKIGRLCEAFPLLQPSIVENAFLAFRHNFRDCTRALDAAFPGARAIDEEELQRPVEIKSKDPPKPKPIPLSGGSHRQAMLKQAARDVVLTGSGDARGGQLNAAYKRLRADAMEQARQRNRAYQRAAQAYNAGNRAAAKALSREGKAADRRMRELHLQAAQEIFSLRQDAIADESRAYTCDLHGLHTDEAMHVLSKKLVDCYSAGLRVCYVVTGAGTHGGGGGGGGGGGAGASGKLRRAVRGWLDENEFAYQETGVAGGVAQGTFVVDLSSYEY